MLRYMSVVLLYAIYCTASENIGIDTAIDGLIGKLPNANGNLTPAQQIIYVYGPRQWKMQNGNNLVDIAGNGYLITSGIGAHKLHIRKLPWYEARKICIREGGHLAVINSVSEEKLLLRILQENNIDMAWLGVHDLFEEGDWNTIMDEPLEATGYSKWSLQNGEQPNNLNGNQNCGVLLKDGDMNDEACATTIAFFCKITF